MYISLTIRGWVSIPMFVCVTIFMIITTHYCTRNKSLHTKSQIFQWKYWLFVYHFTVIEYLY